MRRHMIRGAVISVWLISCLPAFAQKGDSAAGKAVFTKRCATCHGANGEGKEAIAKALKVEMRHLGSRQVLAKTDEQLKKVMIEGSGKMKPTKDLKDSEAADIIAYIRTLKEK